MLVRLTTLLLMVTMLNCTVAYADSEIGKFSDDHERNVTSMTVKLKEYLYEIQQNTSKIEFRVDSPIGDVWVSFEDFGGRFAMLKHGVHQAPAYVDINAESLDTEAGFIGMLLKSESFFDVEKFPSMRFVGNSLEWYSDTKAILKGEMTLQDVTRPVAFYVELVDADGDGKGSERISMKGTTTIKRSLFGIHTLLPLVSDDVNLYLSIDGVKVDASASMISELQQ
jgi:polyisoprenoid-binding protein YceI